MQERKPLSLKFILGFSIAGFLFSGYLSLYKLFSGTCAFNEACPVVWGHPACWYGFVLYVALLGLSLLSYTGKISLKSGLATVLGISFVGVLFAGYLTLGELPAFFARGFGAYTFGLPTCMMGLIFFKLVLISSSVGLFYREK